MSANTWEAKNDLCRCCHAEGSFYSIIDPTIYNLGTPEVYVDVLKSCLDIELIQVREVATAMKICGVCIHRLRDANNFKKQVLKCEEHFKDMYKELMNGNKVITINPNLEIKQEIVYEDDVSEELSPDDDTDRLNIDEENFSDEDDQPIINIKIEKQSATSGDDNQKREKTKRTRIKSKKKLREKKEMTPELIEVTPSLEDTHDDSETITDAKVPITLAVFPRWMAMAKFKLNPSDYSKEGDIYSCKFCDKKYTKYRTLHKHIKTQHYIPRRFICPYCELDCTTISKLTAHKLDKHGVDDRLKCTTCEQFFNSKLQLERHIKESHKLGEKFKCKECDYETFFQNNFYKHTFKHKKVKDYQCRFCEKAFVRKSTLNLHERIHTGDRRRSCALCGEAFVQKSSLNYHMAKYHPKAKPQS